MTGDREFKFYKDKIMWSIRMRASKKDVHISGAEGIYSKSDLQKICSAYIRRALKHPRGKPDRITVTIEELKQKPKTASLLEVTTLRCKSPEKAEKLIIKNLDDLGISKKAINTGLKILRAKKTMRGAAIVKMKSGKCTEPDKIRGVRVSRFGIEKSADKKLSKLLTKSKINTTTVKEALTLASKVNSCREIIAEVCISDDPDYTTGYIASKEIGYLRIPNIKKKGQMHGGRIFFIKEKTASDKIITFLEEQPIVVKYIH
ncbi:MAG: 6-carboxyhexanoate--CoA ligase [Nitrospiraceae bacterium]|nr:6-carboxyhexanoate--CoA ligase [Nitrospiraceae bacterium]